MLSLKAVDRLFARLQATYGRSFMAMYDGIDDNAVKSAWAHELAAYENALHPLAWALENLPGRPPNVIQFRDLCRQAPAAEVPRLPEPKADPARVAAELAKLTEVRNKVASVLSGRLDWAHALKAKDEANPRSVTPTVRKMYQDALKGPAA